MRTCFFIGHCEVSARVGAVLEQAVERHILEYQATDFFVGGYGGFDRLAAGAVKRAKQRYPELSLTLLLPYHPGQRPVAVPPGFDGTFYPSGMEHVPPRLAIVRANRYMVEHSDYLIAYARHPGNSRNLVEYALKREKRGLIQVENLAFEG